MRPLRKVFLCYLLGLKLLPVDCRTLLAVPILRDNIVAALYPVPRCLYKASLFRAILFVFSNDT